MAGDPPKNQHPYARGDYAALLSHIGEPTWLSRSETPLLSRPIEGTEWFDLTGPYPLSVLANLDGFAADSTELGALGYVSAVLVSDPFFGPQARELGGHFEQVREFKTLHANCPRKPFKLGSSQRATIRRFHETGKIESVALADHLPEWRTLYGHLAARIGITGPADFPDSYFAGLAHIPGLVTHAATIEDEIVAMHLWLLHEGIAYSHLTASSGLGRKAGVGHALCEFALRYFADQELIVFGGGAGHSDDQTNGLAQFKSGYSNSSAKSLICGKVLDPSRY